MIIKIKVILPKTFISGVSYNTIMLFAKVKTDFLEYLEIEQNRSQRTIRNYDHYLTRLIDFAGDIKVSDIDAELVRKWRLWLNRLGTNTSDELRKTTQNYHLIALRSFLKYCAKRDIPALSAEKIELARTQRAKVTFLDTDELDRLFGQPDISKLNGLRDRAILELLFSSGLRVSELTGPPNGYRHIWTSARTRHRPFLSATAAGTMPRPAATINALPPEAYNAWWQIMPC
jgi:site-specific recombinase XerC